MPVDRGHTYSTAACWFLNCNTGVYGCHVGAHPGSPGVVCCVSCIYLGVRVDVVCINAAHVVGSPSVVQPITFGDFNVQEMVQVYRRCPEAVTVSACCRSHP